MRERFCSDSRNNENLICEFLRANFNVAFCSALMGKFRMCFLSSIRSGIYYYTFCKSKKVTSEMYAIYFGECESNLVPIMVWWFHYSNEKLTSSSISLHVDGRTRTNLNLTFLLFNIRKKHKRRQLIDKSKDVYYQITIKRYPWELFEIVNSKSQINGIVDEIALRLTGIGCWSKYLSFLDDTMEKKEEESLQQIFLLLSIEFSVLLHEANFNSFFTTPSSVVSWPFMLRRCAQRASFRVDNDRKLNQWIYVRRIMMQIKLFVSALEHNTEKLKSPKRSRLKSSAHPAEQRYGRINYEN